MGKTFKDVAKSRGEQNPPANVLKSWRKHDRAMRDQRKKEPDECEDNKRATAKP